jgi:dUTP pyrophosphatase
MNVPIKRFDKEFPLPHQKDGAACFDLICSTTVTIPPREMKAVHLNVAMKIPEGYALLLFSRSSTPLRTGLMMANGVGVIDPFYSGDKDEQLAFFLNVTDKPVVVEVGDKIVQGMFVKTEAVSWQEVDAMTDQGHGGYNHLHHLK